MMLAAAVAGALLAAAPIPPGLAGKELDRLPTQKRQVVLTIDAGSSADGAWQMLRTLKRKDVPATFFLTGRWVERYPVLAKAIGRRYPVGNHTYGHPHLPALSSSAAAREIVRGERAIRKATGRDPRPLFRFPYGDRNARTIAVANRQGYVSFRWTVDTLGWMPGQTPAGAVSRAVSRLQPGAIILMHIGSPTDAKALPGVIDAIRRRGYGFTTLERYRR